MTYRLLAAGALALPLLAAAQNAPAPQPVPKEGPIAKVNGVAVPRARFDFMMQQQHARGAPDSEQVRNAVREDLIDREVVSQEAAKNGLGKSPDVQTQMDMARQGVLVNAYVTDYFKKHPITEADIQKEYDQAKAQRGDKEYKARHILVETEDQAKGLIADLKKGAKFEDLAAKNSKDPGTKDRGGDLGWNAPGIFDKQFADAMVKLDKGKMTETPVHTKFGYHVIQLEDVRQANFPALPEVKSQVQQHLQQKKLQELVQGLRAKAKVE